MNTKDASRPNYSEETKKKISAGNKGKGRKPGIPCTKEQIKLRADRKRGVKAKCEMRENMSDAYFTKHPFAKKEDSKPYKIKNAKPNGKGRPIDQYTLDDIFIKSWDNSADVARAFDYNIGTIYNCCTNNIGKKEEFRTSAGFIWKFKNENNKKFYNK